MIWYDYFVIGFTTPDLFDILHFSFYYIRRQMYLEEGDMKHLRGCVLRGA